MIITVECAGEMMIPVITYRREAEAAHIYIVLKAEILAVKR